MMCIITIVNCLIFLKHNEITKDNAEPTKLDILKWFWSCWKALIICETFAEF